jgi:PAS domain S-box-containing protein
LVVSIDEAVMRHNPDPVVVTTRDGQILDANPAAEQAFGWSRDELVGRDFTDCFYPPALRSPGKRAFASITPEDAPLYLDTRHAGTYVDRDGAEIPITVHLTVTDIDGQEVILRYIRVDPVAPDLDSIAQSERRFRKIMDASQELVSVVRPDGHWMFSTLGGPLGYPSGHMPPAGILSLVHPDDYALAESALDALTDADPRGGTAGSIVLRVRTIDGRYLWMENTGVNLLGDPDVGALVLQSRDVTARREAAREVAEANARLEELSRQLKSVIERFPAGVWLEDENENLVMTNRTHVELFSAPMEPVDLIGIDAREFVTVERSVFADGEAALARRRAALAAGVPELDVEAQLANGRFLNRDYVPIHEGDEVRSHLWIYRDITERKQLEFDQARARQQLEERNQSLLELDRLKSELVATVSHELRTPLTSIISFAELIRDDPDMSVADREQFTRIISNNANRLLVVVGDLLLLGRAEAGTLGIDLLPVDVPSIVDDAVAALEPAADAANLTIRTDHTPGPTLEADPARLEQVVSNLVTNAIKFTSEGGEVSVASVFADDTWTIEVSDTGIGIPLIDQQTIFDRFIRASNATATPGTGLGLAVVRSLVGLHHGTVELRSQPGEGTTVTVRLPLRKPDGR